MISFSTKIKEEITSKPFVVEREKALLSAYVKTNGFISYGKKISIVLKTQNAKVAGYIYSLFDKVYQIKPNISFIKKMKLNKNITYSLSINGDIKHILDDLGIIFLSDEINLSFVKDDDLIGGYLGGVFLASGSCNNPQSANYHLEMQFDNLNYAKNIVRLIKKHKSKMFNPRIIQRRSNYIVYLKRSDQISSFLVLIGAEESCMEFENVRVDRDYRNIDNRWQICDEANLRRTISSAKQQLEDIRIVENKCQDELAKSEKMRWLIRLRKENDEASLRELAEMMSDIFDIEISKSNVNHLFRKIHELAEGVK